MDGTMHIILANTRITFMSNSTMRSIFGRRTFTATTRPSANRALCTCATDAEAIGTG